MLKLIQNLIQADQDSHLSPVHTERVLDVASDAIVATDAIVSTVAPGSSHHSLVTAKEYSLLPRDCRILHDKLITAPDGLVEILIPIPQETFLHEASSVMICSKDFRDIFHASSSDKWLDVSHITIFAM